MEKNPVEFTADTHRFTSDTVERLADTWICLTNPSAFAQGTVPTRKVNSTVSLQWLTSVHTPTKWHGCGRREAGADLLHFGSSGPHKVPNTYAGMGAASAEAQARTCDFDDGIFILRIENRTKRREGEAANLDDRGWIERIACKNLKPAGGSYALFSFLDLKLWFSHHWSEHNCGKWWSHIGVDTLFL